jgi:hypothetical protein
MPVGATGGQSQEFHAVAVAAPTQTPESWERPTGR